MTEPGATRLQTATAIALVLVPILTAIIAGMYASSSTERDTRVRLIELAIGVLGQEPKPGNRPTREWAIRVINRYSDEKLSADAQRLLVDSLALPRIVGGAFDPRDARTIILMDSAYRLYTH